MTADFSLIRKLCHGAVEFAECDGYLHFYRMSANQRKVYEDHEDFYKKVYAGAGIRLEFMTDADGLALECRFAQASSRLFAYIDVAVNGVLTAHGGVDNVLETPDFSWRVPLDGKLNRVTLYFPCLASMALKKLEFSHAGVLEPVKRSGRIICYGDSITQGYTALFPSHNYSNILADALNVEVFNKAIGGEVFNPAFGAEADPFLPDFFTVAYGTNDWAYTTMPEILRKTRGFLENLTARSGGVPIWLILPIWRSNLNETTAAGTFEEVRGVIREIAAGYPSIRLIDGMELVPHLPEFFTADGLHPNDLGFADMGKNILQKIKK